MKTLSAQRKQNPVADFAQNQILANTLTAFLPHERLPLDTGNNAVRSRLGLPQKLGSCHTALVGGYLIEGHVPASDVRALLQQKPQALGLAVPGMPVGSPGMDGAVYGNRRDPYANSHIHAVIQQGASTELRRSTTGGYQGLRAGRRIFGATRNGHQCSCQTDAAGVRSGASTSIGHPAASDVVR
jgi:hypothetical protein